MFDHPITPEEAKRLTSNDTDQEDIPDDVLQKFPDFTKQHGCCPRCGGNAREQIIDADGPLRFRCRSCQGVSLMADWK